jgi:uncharacterized membrane protein
MPMPDDPIIFGVWTAIGVMTVISYLCRIFGYAIMAHIPITPRAQRALNALPGTIVVATLVPGALKGGVPALLALAAAMVAKMIFRQDIAAFIAGLGAVITARAMGL